MSVIFRSANRRSGWVTATQQDRWYRYGGNDSTSSTTGSGKLIFTFTTSDYQADATVSGANYRIDVTHNLSSSDYLFDCFKTEDNRSINVVDYWRGEDVLKLWFVGNAKDLKIIIDP